MNEQRVAGSPAIWANRLAKTIGERDHYKAHAEKLAEALKCAEMVLAERGVELKEITRALANYASEVQS